MNVFLEKQQLSFIVVEHDRVDPVCFFKNIFIELNNFKNSAILYFFVLVIFYGTYICDVVEEQARGETCGVS